MKYFIKLLLHGHHAVILCGQELRDNINSGCVG